MLLERMLLMTIYIALLGLVLEVLKVVGIDDHTRGFVLRGGRDDGERGSRGRVPAARVNAHVSCNHVPPARGVRTFGTLIWFLTRVRSLMGVEMIAPRKHLH